jgi:hypothetical protein
MKSALFSVAMLVTATAPRLGALTIPSYDYDDLFARSDFVVIAEPLHNTRHTTERSTLGEITPPMRVVGVETPFQTAWVLKGPKQNRFTLHHYREPTRKLKDNAVIIGQPPLVKFDSSKHIDYLLFLVREPDGRFAPTAGQTFVDGVSIWQLTYVNPK